MPVAEQANGKGNKGNYGSNGNNGNDSNNGYNVNSEREGVHEPLRLAGTCRVRPAGPVHRAISRECAGRREPAGVTADGTDAGAKALAKLRRPVRARRLEGLDQQGPNTPVHLLLERQGPEARGQGPVTATTTATTPAAGVLPRRD